MPTHPTLAELLDYADGAPVGQHVSDHVPACPHCTAQVIRQRAVRPWLAHPPQPPPLMLDLAPAILARLAPRPTLPRWASLLWAMQGALGLVLLGVGVMAVPPTWDMSQAAWALMARANPLAHFDGLVAVTFPWALAPNTLAVWLALAAAAMLGLVGNGLLWRTLEKTPHD